MNIYTYMGTLAYADTCTHTHELACVQTNTGMLSLTHTHRHTYSLNVVLITEGTLQNCI